MNGEPREGEPTGTRPFPLLYAEALVVPHFGRILTGRCVETSAASRVHPPVEDSTWSGAHVAPAADRQQTGSRVSYSSHVA